MVSREMFGEGRVTGTDRVKDALPRSLPAVWRCATPRGGRSVLDVDAAECDCFHRSD